MLLAKDSIGVEERCWRPLRFTALLRQDSSGLVKTLYHHFFALLAWGGMPGNACWCLTSEPHWSLYELCSLVKCNNPQILLFRCRMKSFQKFSYLWASTPKWQFPHPLRASCIPLYVVLHMISLSFLFWNNNRYFQRESFGCGAQVLTPCAHVLPEPLSWKRHMLHVCSPMSGERND